MDIPCEGKSTHRPPLLENNNYAYWKAKMRAFIVSLGMKAWIAVIDGWDPSTDNDNKLKKTTEWSKEELDKAEWNFKALYVIFNGVNANEFRRISTCESAKEARDILCVTHEGTNAVKLSKLQKLATKFENIRMNESETFDIFYARLIDVVDNSFNLGEKIPKRKVVRKILRSLPERFQAKVTALEKSKNVDELKLEELVENL